MTTKSPGAYRTISEVSSELQVKAHVLRFWENKFPQISPMKRGGKRRYYTPDDVALLHQIKDLLYNKRYTIEGVQKILDGKKAAISPTAQMSIDTSEVANAHPVDLAHNQHIDFEALSQALKLLDEAALRIDSLSDRLARG